MQARFTKKFSSKAGEQEDEALHLFSPPLTSRKNERRDAIKSHDYEPEESPVWRSHEGAIGFRDRGHFWTSGKVRGLARWIITFVIGLLTAMIAMLITYFTHQLMVFKFEATLGILTRAGPAIAFLSFLGLNVAFVAAAHVTVN